MEKKSVCQVGLDELHWDLLQQTFSFCSMRDAEGEVVSWALCLQGVLKLAGIHRR